MTSEDPSEPPPLDLALQSHLGRVLRKIYTEAAAEPPPPRFAELLDRLERGEGPPPPRAGGDEK